jgi:hypothetical protein
MAKLTGFWHEFLAEMGNKPGAQQGDVTVHLVSPVDGVSHLTGPSEALTLAAEAGQFIGAMFLIKGRRQFIPATNIAGIVDTEATDEKDEKDEKPESRRRST